VCGTVSVPGAHFCHACGAALPAATVGIPTERRVVTVLFGDLSEFTAWSEQLDPERVGAVTDRVMAACAQAVTAFGGNVDKLVGDGIMAVFGAPVAHEDDPERAVRAALAMQRAVRRMVEDEVGGGRRLGLRVGLNTGEVAAGVQAALSYTVIGDTVNTAARLADAAGVGGVYAGSATQRATRDRAGWRRLPPLRLKGKREAVEAYELLGLRDAPGARPGLGDEAPFIGREAEMGRLAGRYLEVSDRESSHVVVITGDAGIGKTRLGTEFGRYAENTMHGCALRVRCAAYGDGRLGPLVRLVRQACGVEPDDTRTEVADRVRRTVDRLSGDGNSDLQSALEPLLELVGSVEGPPRSTGMSSGSRPPGTEARDIVPAAVANLLRAMSEETCPLVIVIDDAHNAPPPTATALADVISRLDGSVLTLLLGRAELSRGSELPGRFPDAEVTALAPLSGAAAARLLRAYLGGGQLPPADQERLLAIAQGNPFYLAELVALLVEQGALTGGSGGWQLKPGSLAGRLLSVDLAAVLTARIDSLPAGARAVLRDAAVVGERIPVRALAVLRADQAVGVPLQLDRLPKDIAELVARRMLRPSNRGGYTFVTAFMRQAAYAGVGKTDLATRHARLARWADALAPEDPELAGIERDTFVARHAEEALSLADAMRLAASSDPRTVASIGVAALGRLAAAAFADSQPAQAAAFLDRAAALARDDMPAELILARSRAWVRTGRYAEALALAERLKQETTADDAEGQAIRMGALLVVGDAERSLGHFEEAAQAWRTVANECGGPPEYETEALRRLGMLDYLTGHLADADERFVQAYQLSLAQHDRPGQGWALQNIAWSATSRGDFDRAEVALDRAATLFVDLRDLAGRSWVTGTEAFVRLLQGRLRQARALAAEFLPYAERLGDEWGVAAVQMVDAYAVAELGELSKADKQARVALRAFEQLDDAWGRSLALVVRGVVARDRCADPAALAGTAIPIFVEAVRIAEQAAHPLTFGVASTLLGYCKLDAGDAAGAESDARATLDLINPLQVTEAAAVGPVVLLARARRAQGDLDEAISLLTDVAKAAASPSLVFPRRQALAHYAAMLVDAGRNDEALVWAQRAGDVPAEDVRSRVVAARALAKALAATDATQLACEAMQEACTLAYATEQVSERAATDGLADRLLCR
jgi:class 3 adenylate cyclase/tetratricopeptide (TPR) repeat protein